VPHSLHGTYLIERIALVASFSLPTHANEKGSIDKTDFPATTLFSLFDKG
jgi:hypothetical protein